MTITDSLRAHARARADQTSINQLARDSGIDVAVVSRFLGGCTPAGHTVDRMAMYLGTKLTSPRKLRAK